MEVTYKLDGIDLKTYGIGISDSKGVLSRPKLKTPSKQQWDNYHGDVLDLSRKFYEARTITLECFIKADGATDFITKCKAFMDQFDKPELRQLLVSVEGSEPLAFMVYLEGGIDFEKTWNDRLMVGTFTLTLSEPEPIKRILKYTRTSAADKTVGITFTSTKMLNIYWGDNSHTFDASGTAVTKTHDYAANGTYYIVVTGDIDAITSLTTTGKVVWTKL